MTDHRPHNDAPRTHAARAREDALAMPRGAADAVDESDGEEGTESFLDFITSIPETVVDSVTGVADEAQNAVNGFIESLAVMIVTSCVIPILVLVFFLWVTKLVLGINVDAPLRMLRPRALRRTRMGHPAT